MTRNDLALVTGGTGKTGRRIVERLQMLRVPVRIGSRSQPVRFDWEDTSSWQPALKGVTRAYVCYQPDLCAPGAVDTVTAFFAQAVAAGVERIVFLSGRGEPEAEQAELALQSIGVDWTILRCSFFAQNFSEGAFLKSILGGGLALPVGDVGEPFVDAEDIGDVAAAALTRNGHSQRLYELTGPRSLTFAEAVGEIAHATGRDLRYSQISTTEYRAELVQAGLPGNVIELLLYLFGTILDGRNTPVTDGVQQALGRAPGDFTAYVSRTAATGMWGA